MKPPVRIEINMEAIELIERISETYGHSIGFWLEEMIASGLRSEVDDWENWTSEMPAVPPVIVDVQGVE